MKKQILTLMLVLVLTTTLVSAGWWSNLFNGVPNLKAPKESDVLLSPSNFGLADLANGVNLSVGWNGPYFWNDSTMNASILMSGLPNASWYYIYQQNPAAHYTNKVYYPTYKDGFTQFVRGRSYKIYMKSGAIWKYVEPRCEDSDGGLNYGVKGTIAGIDAGYFGGVFQVKNYSYDDSCSSTSYLEEMECTPSGTSSSIRYDCSSEGKVCQDGACVVPISNGSSSTVTYQGVLEMLANCGEIDSIYPSENITCEEKCNAEGSIAIETLLFIAAEKNNNINSIIIPGLSPSEDISYDYPESLVRSGDVFSPNSTLVRAAWGCKCCGLSLIGSKSRSTSWLS